MRMQSSLFAEAPAGAKHHGCTSGHRRQDRLAASETRALKDAITRRDVFGRTILHVSVLCNDPESFRQVLRAAESRSILTATDHENGWNVLHYIFYHKRLRCFNVLMAHLDSGPGVTPVLKELLQRKDRGGAAPLALLQNDAKDLFWVPQYINENGRFHLGRRFSRPHLESTDADAIEPAAHVQNAPVTAQGPVRQDTGAASHDWWCHTRGGSDVYVLGANANGNLGVGDSHDRSHPVRTGPSPPVGQRVLEKPRYKFVRMSKYHAVLCTSDGRLYTCGVGTHGRLGQGNAAGASRFKEVVFPGGPAAAARCAVSMCAVSNSHTVVLTVSGALYAWGQNTLNQLGFTSAAPSNSFKTIADVYENAPVEIVTGDLRRKTAGIRGVAVSRIHSLAYSAHSLYFWGLDIGQIAGLPKMPPAEHRVSDRTYKGVVVAQSREVQMRDEIKLVATCETCTCVVTVLNDIYVYYMGQRVKLPRISSRANADAHFDVFKPASLTRAPSIKKVVMKAQSAVHVLLENGDVLAFGVPVGDAKTLRSTRYMYAWLASESSMRAVDIDNSFDGSLLVCTRNGSVLLRSSLGPAQLRRGSSASLASLVPSANKRFQKLAGVNRVLRVACNDAFTSFAFVRDDVDSLPFKLQKNDLFEDMEYLSPLVEPDLYRKQDQLLDTDHDLNCYIADFSYPQVSGASVSDDDRLLVLSRMKTGFASFKDKKEQLETNDFLRKRALEKYASEKNTEPSAAMVFQGLSDCDLKLHILSLKASMAGASTCAPYEWLKEKFCDGKIEFAHRPDFVIGFHTDIFRKRSKLCESIFLPQDEGEYFVHQKIRGAYDATRRVILFLSQVEPLAVLVLVYFIYTNKLLDFWLAYEKNDPKISIARGIRSEVLSLMALFRMDETLGKDEHFLIQLQDTNKDINADVTILLSGGDSVRCSSLIISRSAFFETILSGRWESRKAEEDSDEESTDMKYVGLEEISLSHMKVILSHLQGCHDLHVFDEVLALADNSWDSDDFVNFLLEMIEIADELLLVQLKHLCELAIQEFASIDNVLVLVGHADWIGARKLFLACCWYIYNNLELVIFDPSLRDLDNGAVEKIEVQMQLLDKCKHPQFVVGDRGEVDWNVFCQNRELANKITAGDFASDLEKFNRVFMSDAKGFSSFEPLVDVKADAAVSGEGRRKLTNRKMSSKGSGDILADMRKLSISSTAATTLHLQPQSGRQSDHLSAKEEDCAVIDDEDFEVVGSRKRKSKTRVLSNKGRGTMSLESLLQNESYDYVSSDHVSTSVSEESAIKDGEPIRKSSNTSNPGPILGPALGEAYNDGKKQTRIKFAPAMKLSQKERRKLRSHSDHTSSRTEHGKDSSSQQTFRNPWKIPTGDDFERAVLTKSNSKLSNLPVLGQAETPAPKLSAIMLEETTRLAEEQGPIVSQTLQEIQQEQEFAKWWEEECKRVQQLEQAQASLAAENDASSYLFRAESKRGGRARRGRGRRGGEPRATKY